MAATMVDMLELPARLAELLALVAGGAEVVVTDGAIPRARLVPFAQAAPRTAGLHPGSMTAADDFDASLPDDFWFGGP
jgi:antitoxin (DNA-binding transcriptional repressor) of toxin-antitoxin stability system